MRKLPQSGIAGLIRAVEGVSGSGGASEPAFSPSPRGALNDWPAYHGHQTSDHYSSLSPIHRSNVAKLEVAWTFDTHEEGGLLTDPLVVGRMLFAYTPSQKIVALGPGSGRAIWTFDRDLRVVSRLADSVTGFIYPGVERREAKNVNHETGAQ